MQATAYEGYFSGGCFYTSGKALAIPEKRRVFLTILEDSPEIQSTQNSPLQFDFATELPPLPDSFFDPLPEEELKLWGL